jgi:hypothetical protein
VVLPPTAPVPEPIFVDRRAQLRLFDDLLAALTHGERRHVALLGLRRIGKTLLLDEVRVRHAETCIVKIAVDTVVSTPEAFALELMASVLRAALGSRGTARPVTTQTRSISTAAGLLGEDVVAHVDELLELVESSGRGYGRLLAKAFLFPAAVSDALGRPILVMLDEFQEIRRLRHFPGTDNLWAALREALDRRGRVAFVIAGSVVTAVRALLRAGNDPLFTRFDELDLPPFPPEDTAELATGVWERSGLGSDQNAVQRLHTLSQGFPFYAHALARAAADLVRGVGDRVLGEHVDAAFQRHLLDRDSALAIYLQYLFGQAIGGVRGENIPEAVLRYLAEHEGRRVADVARALRRTAGQVHDVVLELIGIDVLRREDDGGVWFVDPLLPVWIALERDRQEPLSALSDPRARARVLQLHQERLLALREAAGPLLEKRVHNALRQFRGQTVSGKLLGAGGTITLPTIRDVRNLDLPDPEGRFSGSPGGVELDGVTDGTETWLVECKHTRGAVTAADVDRFLRKRAFFEEATGRPADRLWLVSNAGFRTDGRERCDSAGVYHSGSRELARLERALAS